jgi:hypothetical protein
MLFFSPARKVVALHFSVVPSFLLYAIVRDANIASLFPILKMCLFGRAHVVLVFVLNHSRA